MYGIHAGEAPHLRLVEFDRRPLLLCASRPARMAARRSSRIPLKKIRSRSMLCLSAPVGEAVPSDMACRCSSLNRLGFLSCWSPF